jgi:nitroreductase
MKKDEILKIHNFRHACKVFDESKKISQSDLSTILETGRLSPSSFGMEQWKFVVVQNKELKQKLRPYCWDQAQITTCSDLVILLAKIDDIKAGSKYTREMLARRGLDKDSFDAYCKRYDGYVNALPDIEFWSQKQSYIAGANMATTAAMLEIDSCFIEGFEKDKVEEILSIDTSKYSLSYMLALGYRVNPQKDKLRLGFDDVVEFIK